MVMFSPNQNKAKEIAQLVSSLTPDQVDLYFAQCFLQIVLPKLSDLLYEIETETGYCIQLKHGLINVHNQLITAQLEIAQFRQTIKVTTLATRLGKFRAAISMMPPVHNFTDTTFVLIARSVDEESNLAIYDKFNRLLKKIEDV